MTPLKYANRFSRRSQPYISYELTDILNICYDDNEVNNMNYCSICGSKLIKKESELDGLIPFCPTCNSFRFPTFNSAISTIIFNPDKTKVLLIKQYGKPHNILVAGYINKGENANEALVREIKEEVGLSITYKLYNDNLYFEKSNTLIHNFITISDSETFTLNQEVDSAKWFTLKEAIQEIKPNSLAKYFLYEAMHKMKLSEVLFQYEKERIYLNDDKGKLLAEIVFPCIDGVYDINRTYVSSKLRGLGIASSLMNAAIKTLQERQAVYKATCSYAIKWLEKHQASQL